MSDLGQDMDIACAVGMATSVRAGAVGLDAEGFARMCAVIVTEAGLKRFRSELERRDALVPEAERAIQARLTALYVQIMARSK
jgi:hypothetical protein